MVLYHFCAAHMLQSILETGLRLGMCPIVGEDGVCLIQRCQWLTAEKDPGKQSWATRALVAYERTACRLTVRIPDSHRRKLLRAGDFVRQLPEESREIVDAWDGSDRWYLYRGYIPARWIVGHRWMQRGEV